MNDIPPSDDVQDSLHLHRNRSPTEPAWFMEQAAFALLTRYTTVHGYSALLHRVVASDPLDPARVAHYIEALAHQVGDLGRLLEQYLQAVELRTGHVTLIRRSVGLAELIETVQAQCAHLPECTDRHPLVVAQADAVTGHWDPHWVVVALAAIVSNAMTFTPDGGAIQVQIQRQAETAILTVQDPGLGIQDEERAAMVQPFVRGSAAKGMKPGWGLGLYIADQAVQAHGGALALAGAPGGGSTVTITLPLQTVSIA